MWISAAHITDKNNIELDQQPIILEGATEFKLHQELFHKIVDKFRKPAIDLVAYKINRLVKVSTLASRIKSYGS